MAFLRRVFPITPLICVTLRRTTSPSAAQTPNISIMMADDPGYGYFSCRGATKIETPDIDRLAQEVMRFADIEALKQN